MSKNKTIKSISTEIAEKVENLKGLLNESQAITYNKIWVPDVGVVTLWETKK